MTTGAQAIERFSEDTGLLAATILRMTKALMAHNLWPKSGFGGGKAARHVEVRHLANLIIAFAGLQPHEAADMVARLRPLVWKSRDAPVSVPLNVPDEFLATTLGRCIECMIELVVEVLSRPEAETELVSLRAWGWHVVLAPDFPAAFVNYPDVEGVCTDTYGPEHGLLGCLAPRPAAPRRTVRIPFPLIETAAHLLVDTLARQADLPLSTSDAGVTTTSSERKTPAPHHRGPAPTRDQSAAQTNGKPGTLLTPERSEAREKPQALPYERTSRGPPRWSDRDDKESSAAAGTP
jgi:hypothetical protein